MTNTPRNISWKFLSVQNRELSKFGKWFHLKNSIFCEKKKNKFQDPEWTCGK